MRARLKSLQDDLNHRFFGLGSAFFPEHHPRRTWKRYVDLISQAGFRFVRMGEFTWDKLEPREGEFDFEMLDSVMELLNRKRIKVLLCTPTAVPPIWACEKYPDLFPVLEDGKIFGFGLRRYTCPTSASYHRLSESIVSAMAGRYGRSRQVIGWQLDNEFGHPFCFCPRCRQQFQAWCRKRYGSIKRFNDALGTHFLGQTVQSFEQIPFPLTYPHPGLWLMYHQFYSDMTIACFRRQVETLRSHGVTAPITTNMMVTWYGYDHERMGEYLDVIAGDHYGLGNDDLFGRGFAKEMFAHAYLRGIKHGRNIWFNEFQCGRQASLPLPGQVRWEALTQIGRGTNLIDFFRFDTCPSGMERDAFGLIGVHGKPGRVFHEIKQLNTAVARLAPLLQHAIAPPAEIGMLYTYANHAEFVKSSKIPAFEAMCGNGYSNHISRHFRAIVQRNIPCDIVYPDADFYKYRVIVAPALYILPRALARKLEQFVAAGGILMLTSFSGVADENGRIWDVPVPAHLSGVFGIEVLDYGAISLATGNMRIIPDHDGLMIAPIQGIKWLDEIRPCARNLNVLARIDNPFFNNMPALTSHRYKKGWGYYLGCVLDQQGYDLVYQALISRLQLKPVMELPDGIYATVRVRDNSRIYFINNPSNEKRALTLDRSYRNLLTGNNLHGVVELEPFDVLVVR